MIGCSLVAAAIGVHALTWHDKPGFEAITPGAYVVDTEGCTAGVLRNSHGRLSLYAGQTWEAGRWGFSLVAITGYPRAPVLPAPIASVRLGDARLIFIPPSGRGSSAAIHLAVEF